MQESDMADDLPSSTSVLAPAEPAADAITVLVVDDERSNVESLEKIFMREGMRVLTAFDAKHALEQVRSHRVHVLLTDLMMPGTTGLELLRAVKQLAPDVEVVLMTAYGSVEAAVSAMREGAYDFVEKPLKRMNIVEERAQGGGEAAPRRGEPLAEGRDQDSHAREIVGQLAGLAARGRRRDPGRAEHATVLVLGESGTGKELLARYIHEQERRAQGARSSRSTAPRSPRRSSRASSSATSAARSPAPSRRRTDASRRPRAGRSSSTRSASSRPRCR